MLQWTQRLTKLELINLDQNRFIYRMNITCKRAKMGVKDTKDVDIDIAVFRPEGTLKFDE